MARTVVVAGAREGIPMTDQSSTTERVQQEMATLDLVPVEPPWRVYEPWQVQALVLRLVQRAEAAEGLSAPNAAAVLLSLKAECERQHRRAEAIQTRLERLIVDVGDALDGQYPGDEPCEARAVQQQREALDAAQAENARLRAALEAAEQERDLLKAANVLNRWRQEGAALAPPPLAQEPTPKNDEESHARSRPSTTSEPEDLASEE